MPDRRWWIRAAAVAILAFGWWFTGRRPFSPGAFRALLFVAVVLVVIATVRRERTADPARAAPRRATRLTTAPRSWCRPR